MSTLNNACYLFNADMPLDVSFGGSHQLPSSITMETGILVWARNEIEERSYSNQFSVVFETEPINLELHCKHFMNCDQWTAVSLLNGLTRNPVFSKLSFTRVSEMGKSHLQTPVQTSPLAILHVNWPPGLLSSFQVLTDVHANRIGSSLKMCRNCVE